MTKMPPEVRQIRELLRRLPTADGLSALLIGIVDANGDALDVALRLLNALKIVSEGQGTASRYTLANHLRNVADELERPEILRGLNVN